MLSIEVQAIGIRRYVEAMERHGHLALTPEVRAGLQTMSAATIDRALRWARELGAVHKSTHAPRSAACADRVAAQVARTEPDGERLQLATIGCPTASPLLPAISSIIAATTGTGSSIKRWTVMSSGLRNGPMANPSFLRRFGTRHCKDSQLR